MLFNIKYILFTVIRYLSYIQNRLSARHTAYYIATESFTIGIISTIILIFYGISIIQVVTSISTFFIFSFVIYLILYARSKPNSPAIIEINKYIIVILLFLSQIPVIFSYTVTRSVIVLPISAVIFIYTILLINRNKKYTNGSEFFVNQYSDVYDNWVEASVCLENAIKNMDTDNDFRTYYWGLRAEWLYNNIVHREKLQFRIISSELSTASNIISASAIADSKSDKDIYKNEAYRALSEAKQSAKKQICDNCKNQLKGGSIYGYEEKNNICSNCNKMNSFGSIGVNKTQSHNRTQNKKETENIYEDKYQNSDYGEQRSENYKYRKRNRKNKNEELDKEVKDAFDIFDVDKNINLSELKEVYREKVKYSHPDSGGSAKEFKKVNDAYNIIRDYIKTR